MRVIMHADMDAFYAAIEQRNNPEYMGLPIAVRLGKSGVIASASYEAKRYGVKSAMSVNEANKKCPQLYVIEADMNKYAAESRKFQDICISHCREFEPYSVSGIPEEGWLDYTDKIDIWEDAKMEAKRLKFDIQYETGMTASVGVAYSRIIAKMASDYEKPDGLTVVSDEEEFRSLFWGRGVRDLFMVGDAIERRLKRLGMNTIEDIAEQSLDYLVRHFKPSRGTYLHLISHGIDKSKVKPYYEHAYAPKSIGNGKTVKKKGTRDFNWLSETLRELSRHVGTRLRGNGYYFKTVTLEINGYDESDSRKNLARSRSLGYYSDDWHGIYDNAIGMLYNELKQGISVRRVGVRACNLTQEPQLRLF